MKKKASLLLVEGAGRVKIFLAKKTSQFCTIENAPLLSATTSQIFDFSATIPAKIKIQRAKMRILKLKIVDWFSGDFDSNFIVKILRKNGYECVESEDPDYLLYSVFGYENAKYDCVKIFYTGENIIPDFNVCDYAIGVNHIAFEDRYLYFPLYLHYADSTAKAAKKHENATLTGKNRFCNYIYSNKLAAKIRGDFFEFLNAYKRVDAPGADKNNCPRLPKNSDGNFTDHKFEFMQRYKFSIAFENSATRGYVTEKIIQAFAAGTIPIYWGDKSVAAGICGAFEADNTGGRGQRTSQCPRTRWGGATSSFAAANRAALGARKAAKNHILIAAA